MIRCRDALHVFSHETVPGVLARNCTGGNTSEGQRVNGAASPGLWTKGMDGRPATAAANGSTSIALTFLLRIVQGHRLGNPAERTDAITVR